jgi:hypothetical protein
LVGDTTQLYEGWLPVVATIHLATDPGPDRARLATDLRDVAAREDLPLTIESPADVVPLPTDAEVRHRAITDRRRESGPRLDIWHYDPYSVICRGVVRGDEPDYHTALRYLRHGWVVVERMTELVEDLLPRFTEASIAQDPAEFRRKLRGLLQMWRAEHATRHPSTATAAQRQHDGQRSQAERAAGEGERGPH